MSENIEVKVENGVKELVIRKGDALPLQEPVSFHTEGTITAPRDFKQQREQHGLIDPAKAVVWYSKKDKNIKLNVDTSNYYSDIVEGTLKVNPDLEAFHVNKNKIWTLTELIGFLKMNRRHFEDPDQHKSLLDQVSNFKASINTELERSQDTRGNFKAAIEKKVKTELELNFTLNMPLFEGLSDKYSFKVDVCFMPRDNGLDIWLESVELAEMLEEQTERIIMDELKHFGGYAILEV